ncbi:MAG: exodeoxyribonuclease VII large subunit [bacterium]
METTKTEKLSKSENEIVFTVSEFLEFVNEILRIRKAAVKGEVGEKIGKYPSGIYFNLIDKQEAVLKCFIPAWMNRNIGVDLKPGMEIVVVGYPTIWRKSGDFKFNVDRVELVGEGELKKQFEFLKTQLTSAGYFNEDVKKPLPRFVGKIGLIASQFGRGAKKDFLTRLGEFGFNVFFYDVRVEGHSALDEITGAIKWFNQSVEKMDVLVITRGGGDWESLKAFNSEEIVKAIFSSKIPIVTGIGHEDDETLADLAGDVRASTPTHAAKIISENWEMANNAIPELERNIGQLAGQIVSNQINFLATLKQGLNTAFRNYYDRFNFLAREFINNISRIKILMDRELELNRVIARGIFDNIQRWQKQLNILLKTNEEKLQLSSPTVRLKQGYSVVFDDSGNVIKDASRLKIGQKITTKYHRGKTTSEIKQIINL